MNCIHIRKCFGRRYKIVYDECYEAEYGKCARKSDPWHQVLLCQRGHISPWGDDELGACTDKNGATANKLRKLPFVRVVQDGDDGVNVVFAIEHFAEVAKLLKPRRRRQLTDEQRREAAERLRKHRYQKNASVHSLARQIIFSARPCEPQPRGDLGTSPG